MDHGQLLEKLLAAFPEQVFLVNRYKNRDLNLDEDGVMRIFLPDFHWMSKDRAEYYTGGYRFNGNLILPNNKPVLLAFLELLEGQTPVELEVFQVGDCYDIWREIKDENESVEEAFLRIQTDPKISGLVSRLKAFNMREVRGNHDNWLVNLPGGYPERKDAKELDAAGGKIHISHGHLYDSFEMIVPDAIKSDVVRRVPKAKAESKNIGLISRRDYQEVVSFIKGRAKRGDSSLLAIRKSSSPARCSSPRPSTWTRSTRTI